MLRPIINKDSFPFSSMRKETVEIDGSTLEVTTMGSGTPVFCIHGLLVHDAFIAPLSRFCPDIFKSYKFYSVSRLGYGFSSDCPEGYDMAKAVDLYFKTMETLNLSNPHLLAFSFGGNIALQMLIDQPTRFASAVFSEAYWVDATSVAENIAAFVAAQELFAVSPLLAAMKYQELICGKSFHSYVDITCDREEVNEHLPRGAATMFNHDMALLDGWAFPNFIETAQKAKGPALNTLLAIGAESEYYVPGFRHRHRLLENWFPNTRAMVLPNTSHAMQLSSPKLFGDQCQTFWDNQRP